MHTDATSPGVWETFTVEWLNADFTSLALKTAGGNYVTAVNGGGFAGPNDATAPIHTDATSIGPWERLTLNFMAGSKVTIQVGRYYLTAVNGGGFGGGNDTALHTDSRASTPGPWETFTLIK
jgi:hypothetical protein